MSFHLAQLKNGGLVEARKEGRSIIYTANRKRVKKLASYLTAKSPEPDATEYTL
jgi:DNA-binding transcriptional ArsR family regulator